LARAVEREGW